MAAPLGTAPAMQQTTIDLEASVAAVAVFPGAADRAAKVPGRCPRTKLRRGFPMPEINGLLAACAMAGSSM